MVAKAPNAGWYSGYDSPMKDPFRGRSEVAEQTVESDRAKELRTQRFALVDDERQLRHQIAERVLDGRPVDDLRAERRENREAQEDLAAASALLWARCS